MRYLMHFSSFGTTINSNIIAVYKQSERFYIVGIEIKEWDKRVHPKMAMEYMEKRIKNNFKVLTNAVDDPFQKTILEFCNTEHKYYKNQYLKK
jgi:hypothetical protein